MKRFSITFLAWGTFAAACVLWVGAGLFAWTISSAEEAQAQRLASVERESAQQSTALRARTLARETQEARQKIGEIAHKDIVEILTTIEQVGKDAGIPVEVSGAAATPVSNPALPAYTLTFTISAQGTFSQVMRIAALIESLPIPSTVRQARLTQVVDDPEKPQRTVWTIVMEVQVLTTFAISS